LKPPIVGNKAIDALIVVPKSVTIGAGSAIGFCPEAVPPKPRLAKRKPITVALNPPSRVGLIEDYAIRAHVACVLHTAVALNRFHFAALDFYRNRAHNKVK
jgi:hypothetical protein